MMKKMPTECKIPDSLSVDEFQEQLHTIFEKKGILQDVRSFLRTQMINVIRGMQSGYITVSPQRHLQRMDISNQVMNILISEYLLQLHFSYTLSMFTSEIPLADMAFDFAKRLFSVATVRIDNSFKQYDVIHFKQKDVRDILNILGFPKDSPMKADIIQMYKQKDRQPLLVCIIKTLVQELKEYSECTTENEDSLRKTSKDDHKCAKNTNNRSEIHWKDKYEKKIQKLNFAYGEEIKLKMKKTNDGWKQEQTKLETNMQNEWKRREEQLKNEIEQVKEDCSRHIKTVEHNIIRKKKFLWQIFKSIQEQIETLKKARDNVKKEDHKVKAKKRELQLKLTEGEAVLSKKGEELNKKIKQEMLYLEDQMQNFEKEKRALSRERQSLNNLQSLLECERAALDTEKKRAVSELEYSHRYNKQLQEHCQTLKSQLDTFNRTSVRSEDKKICIERATQTEPPDSYQTCLNNVPEVVADRISSYLSVSDSRDNMKQTVVNNLKKWKNVNKTNDLEVQTDVRGVTRSEMAVGTGEATGLMRQVLEHTQEDNRNLRAFLDLQKAQIQELTAQKVSLQSELATANLTLNNLMRMKDANERILAVTPSSLRPTVAARGAGEEVGITCNSPVTSNRKPADKSEKKFNGVTCRLQMQKSLHERPSMLSADHNQLFNIDNSKSAKLKAKQPRCPSTRVEDLARRRGHKTRVKETTQDQNLDEEERFTKEESLDDPSEDCGQFADTEKIVNAVRRRFRKLEIEAEAVDKAYRQFKTRQSDTILSYGRYGNTSVATTGTVLGKGKFTNLQSFTSDILSRPIYISSQYPEYLKSHVKKRNMTEIDNFKNGLLDEPLINFREMYVPASIKSKSRSSVINSRFEYGTQASVKDCAVSPIYSPVSKIDGKILSSNKGDNTSEMNRTVKVNHNENVKISFYKSFDGLNVAQSAIRDEVNNVNDEILPVAIKNYENFEKYLGKQYDVIETNFEGNVNNVASNDSIVDKANKEKYLSRRNLDMNLKKHGTYKKELSDENSPLNEKLVVPKQKYKNNIEPKKCKCRRSGDCLCFDLKGFSVHKSDDETKVTGNGAVMVSVESVLTNDPVLIGPKSANPRKPRLNIETVNLEESAITVEKDNVEETYKHEGLMATEENLLLDDLNFIKPNDPDNVHEVKSVTAYTLESHHLDHKENFSKSESMEKEHPFQLEQKLTENTNYISVSIGSVAATQSIEFKEEFNKLDNVKKDSSFHSIPNNTNDTNVYSVPIEIIVDSQDSTHEEDFHKSESVEIENSSHAILIPSDQVNRESPKSEAIEDLKISQSEDDDNSEFSKAIDVESDASDLSVHKASSGDSFWS